MLATKPDGLGSTLGTLMLKGQNQLHTLSLDLHTCQRAYLHICVLVVGDRKGMPGVLLYYFSAYSHETGSPSEPGARLAASKTQ